MVFYVLLALWWLRVAWLAIQHGGLFYTLGLVISGLIGSALLVAIRAFIRWRYRRKHTVFVEFVAPR